MIIKRIIHLPVITYNHAQLKEQKYFYLLIQNINRTETSLCKFGPVQRLPKRFYHVPNGIIVALVSPFIISRIGPV